MVVEVLIILLSIAFIPLWVITLMVYTPLTLKLYKTVEYIDVNKDIDSICIKWYHRFSLFVVDAWVMNLPTHQKYIKYHEVVLLNQRIKRLRKLLVKLGAICIVLAITIFSIL